MVHDNAVQRLVFVQHVVQVNKDPGCIGLGIVVEEKNPAALQGHSGCLVDCCGGLGNIPFLIGDGQVNTVARKDHLGSKYIPSGCLHNQTLVEYNTQNLARARTGTLGSGQRAQNG